MFFFLFGLVNSFDLCGLCVKYGKTALKLARTNAPREVIVKKATAKCQELGGLLTAVCQKYLETQLDELIAEAKSNTKTAEEYCVEKGICSKTEIQSAS